VNKPIGTACVAMRMLLLLLLLLAIPSVVRAQDYTYETNNNTITIIQYTGSGGAVRMPGIINGLLVTSIGERAFKCFPSSGSVIMSPPMDLLFSGCALTSITIPNGVTNIGFRAFSDCTNLTTVTIPDSVTSMGWWAFNECTHLTNIVLPNGITTIENGAFYGCTSLTSISIPSSVTRVREGAFWDCRNLTNVTIPDGVTSIENYVFSDTKLTNVTLPNTVTAIGGKAFGDCKSLINVTVGNGVNAIGLGAFSNCTKLTSIYFQGNAPSLGKDVFFGDPATVYYASGTTGWGEIFGGRPAKPWTGEFSSGQKTRSD
jgi:Leucine Rich Repeat (LRR) protein